ncbi:MAG TPA: ArsR family transcriptional regulator, partial [Methanosarcinales archaeon]|nr:ArsR family transcriptional regulator [Methanosarcinales archaeon]
MQPDEDADEKVLILPLGEESKKVTKVLSNDSARQVLEMLADKPMSASDIAEELEIPLTTAKYNLDALIESGLIKVKETKWSVKGRKIKIYAPIRKLIVVVPDKTDKKSVAD